MLVADPAPPTPVAVPDERNEEPAAVSWAVLGVAVVVVANGIVVLPSTTTPPGAALSVCPSKVIAGPDTMSVCVPITMAVDPVASVVGTITNEVVLPVPLPPA